MIKVTIAVGAASCRAQLGGVGQGRAAAGSYTGCIAGALSRAEYLDGLTAAGFTDASVTFTHEAATGMHSAIIRAVKPATA